MILIWRVLKTFLVSCHEKNEDGDDGEKIKIEENVSPIEVVKQLKFIKYPFCFY